MARRRILAGAALAFALAASLAARPAAAQSASQAAASYSLGGSVEARPFGRWTGTAGSRPLDAGSWAFGQATSLGIELGASGARARAAASLEAALLTGAAAAEAWAFVPLAQAAGLESTDLLLVPAAPGSSSATLLEARVRTLYLKLDYDWASLTAGRQVVNYLRGALWSPTDPFTELDLSGISPVRRGSDALRLVAPLGQTASFDLVAAPAADFAGGRYAGRLSGFFAGIDGAALAFRDGAAPRNGGRGSWSGGADFKADLLVGLNGELLYTAPDTGAGWLRAAGGADYSFGDLIVAAEYYYNGGGALADLNAPEAHNVYASLLWKASDFLALTASLVDGISSGSWTAAASASLDAAQNATLAAYAKLGYSSAASAADLAAAFGLPATIALSAGWLAEAGINLVVKF